MPSLNSLAPRPEAPRPEAFKLGTVAGLRAAPLDTRGQEDKGQGGGDKGQGARDKGQGARDKGLTI